MILVSSLGEVYRRLRQETWEEEDRDMVGLDLGGHRGEEERPVCNAIYP